jgi:low temperature requirement protein LtrA
MLVAGGFAGGTAQWILWSAAVLLQWGSPAFTAVEGFRIQAAHFVERHGLIVLIALGESIVAVSVGVAADELRGGIVIAVLGLALAAALWWLYFDGEDERAERALDAAPPGRAQWLALYAFGYAFLPILGGIVVFAAGIKNAVAHHGEPLTASTAWCLAAGVAGYLAGLAWFRRCLGIRPVGPRLAIAAAALPAALVGLTVSPEAQLAVLAAIVVAGILAEAALAKRRPLASA